MPLPLDEQLKNDIATQIRSGLHHQAIREVCGVSSFTVRKIASNLKYFGHHTAPASLRRHSGRPRALNTAAQQVLKSFVEAKPWAYQEEMQDFLLDELDVSVHQSIISRALKKMKISLKNLRREATERNQDLRDFYVVKLSEFTADQMIFVDESAANEHTAWRKRGWSELGIKPSVSRPVKRSKRWSILPAYTIDGIIAHHIHHGNITGDRFLMFLEYMLLPQCSAFPGPRSVIIMDNCSTHYVREVKELCDSHGVRLLYLPPYSPDYNPIEELFSVIKAWMKKNFVLLDIMGFEDFIEMAVTVNSTGRDARNHFSHCRINVH